MNVSGDLDYMERFYMALADKTRLRLLNLMRQNEVCVCFFTEVLGDSQPKVSRHLAYLRNAGIVNARRDGKWIHYSIRWPENEKAREVLEASLEWLAAVGEMQLEVEKYETVCCTPELLVQIARTPIDFLQPATQEAKKTSQQPRIGREMQEKVPAAHNELEEFLL